MPGITILNLNTMIAIQNLTFDNDTMSLRIDGKQINIPLSKVSIKLKDASDIQRNFYKISPSDYGIHWPLIDEDLSVEALLKLAA